jgi:hypothetical protein
VSPDNTAALIYGRANSPAYELEEMVKLDAIFFVCFYFVFI